MSCLRLALASAALLVMVAASEAQPTRITTPNQPTPLAVVVLNGIGDPAVVAELKLKDEQVKTLVARQKELWDEAYTTAPGKFAEGNAARMEATDAFLKKTLTAEQYKRATQLGAQRVLRTTTFGKGKDGDPTFRLTSVTKLTLQRYPELATVFNLTEAQKKQVTGPVDTSIPPSQRTITMTKEQTDAAKEFLGNTIKAWAVMSDPRLAMRPTPPAGFLLLEAKAVRDELKITDAEAKAVTALAQKWQRLDSSGRFGSPNPDLSPKEIDEQGAVLKAESEKALAALKPEQLARLKQIAFQVSLSNFAPGRGAVTAPHIEQAYSRPAVVKELALSDKQAEELQAIRVAFDQDATALFESADSFAPAEKKLNELVAARQKKAEAVLTADQSAKWKALVGEPFTGITRPDRIGGPGTGTFPGGRPALGDADTAAVRAAQFGRYANEFTLLAGSKAAQEELKLTPEQVKKVSEQAAEIRRQFSIAIPGPGQVDTYAKAYVDRSKVVEESLKKVLTEDQAKRFRQMMLQYREHGQDGPSFASTNGIWSAIAYPGVAEEVKLNEEQQKKLFAGTKPAEVLTAEQKTAIQKMLGDPFKGQMSMSSATFGPDRGPGGPGRQTLAMEVRRAAAFGKYTTEFTLLAGNKSLQDELKMTPEQIKKAEEARTDILSKYRPLVSEPAETYTKTYAERSKAVEEALGKILTEDQARRFRQIMLQSRERGQDPLVAAVQSAASYPGVAEAVKLNEEQKKKLVAGMAAGEVLTAEQKTAIQKMLGDPFKGDLAIRPGGFPPPDRPAFSAATTALRLVALSDKVLEDEFKLTPEQVKTVAAARETYRKAISPREAPGVGPGGGFGTSATVRNRAADAFEKAVTEVLTEDQKKRLAQLALQFAASRNLVAALTTGETAKALDLSNDQTAKLKALDEEATKLQTLRTTHVLNDREQNLGLKMRDAADDRALAVLTEPQKKKWKELTGEPHAFPKLIPSRFGGFGGPGGVGGLGGGFGDPFAP